MIILIYIKINKKNYILALIFIFIIFIIKLF